MILYVENPKDSTKKLLEIINKFSKVAGYKIEVWKYVVFLYTNNELSEKKFKKAIPFTIAPKRIKYIGVNLTKEIEDLYSENCKTLMKGIEENINKWKDIKTYHILLYFALSCLTDTVFFGFFFTN